ncbi:hypothetical protein EJ06DRAFT_45113 [Trichodelitschia bisporula]|uniref:Uncharacterized protein n=1 Tax=Trichodelitschia bisporula TaxID=703511 RepID=A0A6G1HVL3_9PEZI|nr:hypothetical protein EJ06DRAFT_45113 [Trichodelitschia bisporula]
MAPRALCGQVDRGFPPADGFPRRYLEVSRLRQEPRKLLRAAEAVPQMPHRVLPLQKLPEEAQRPLHTFLFSYLKPHGGWVRRQRRTKNASVCLLAGWNLITPGPTTLSSVLSRHRGRPRASDLQSALKVLKLIVAVSGAGLRRTMWARLPAGRRPDHTRTYPSLHHYLARSAQGYGLHFHFLDTRFHQHCLPHSCANIIRVFSQAKICGGHCR